MHTLTVKALQDFMVRIPCTESAVGITPTTTLVVSRFTPIKDWIQAYLACQFEDDSQPSGPLCQFDRTVEAVREILGPLPFTCRLVNTAGRAYRPSGGAVDANKDGNRETVHTCRK